MPAVMNLRLYNNAYVSSLSGVYYGNQTAFQSDIAPLMSVLPSPLTSSISSNDWIDTLLANSNGNLTTPLDYDVVRLFLRDEISADFIA